MKTFNAEEFNKHPHRVYREADKEGSVRINHSHYRDRIFELRARNRREEWEEEEDKKRRGRGESL